MWKPRPLTHFIPLSPVKIFINQMSATFGITTIIEGHHFSPLIKPPYRSQFVVSRRGQHLAGFHKIRELVQAERRTLRAPVVESPKKRLPVGVSNGIETLIPDCNRHGQETPLGGFFRTVRHKIDIVFLQDALQQGGLAQPATATYPPLAVGNLVLEATDRVPVELTAA